jgi:hypothetical protein
MKLERGPHFSINKQINHLIQVGLVSPLQIELIEIEIDLKFPGIDDPHGADRFVTRH